MVLLAGLDPCGCACPTVTAPNTHDHAQSGLQGVATERSNKVSEAECQQNACKRGVDVRVMVPKKGDILPFQLASEAFWARALKAGIRIFRWEEAVLHAKTAVIDDQWATVGSFNIDHRSWTMNLEVNVNVVGHAFAQKLKKVFLDDQEASSELTRKEWSKRPWYLRLAQDFFYTFRRFM